MSKHCDAATCVFDVLAEVFPDDDIGNIALEYTCFPMDCDVASKQARVFVDRIKAGEDKRTVMAETQERIYRAMDEAMERDMKLGTEVKR